MYFYFSFSFSFLFFFSLAPNSSGQDGSVNISLIKSGTLDTASKQSFPRELLVIMRRQAEDLLLGNSKDQKGRDALEFILTLANERSDVKDIKNCEFLVNFPKIVTEKKTNYSFFLLKT